MKLGMAAVALVGCASCAPDGYVYDTGRFTPRPISDAVPVVPATPEYLAAREADRRDFQAKINAGCNEKERDRLTAEINDIRKREDLLRDDAQRNDPPGSYRPFLALADVDRALQ